MFLDWFTLIVVVTYLAYEAYALKTGRTITISRWVYNASNGWPLLPFILGLVVGGLAVHFLWHWCPASGVGKG